MLAPPGKNREIEAQDYLMECFYDNDPAFGDEIDRLKRQFGIDDEGHIDMRGQGGRHLHWGIVSQNLDDATYCDGVRGLAKGIGLPTSWGSEAVHRCVLHRQLAHLSSDLFDGSLFYDAALMCKITVSIDKPGITTPQGKIRKGQAIIEPTDFHFMLWSTTKLEEFRQELYQVAGEIWKALQPSLQEMPGYKTRRRGPEQLERDVEWLYHRMRNKERYKDIADSSGYDEEYVKRRVWQTAKAMGIRLRQSIPLKP